MDLKGLMLTVISQEEKDKYHIIILCSESKKNFFLFRNLKTKLKYREKTGVCHKWDVEVGEMAELFLFFISNKRENVNCSVTSNLLQLCGLQPTRILCPRGSPGKNTGVGSQSLLQEIFPTRRLDPGLLHCRQILYHLC